MAAQISGLSTHTIRAWEKRYGALRPDRTETGRRQYSTEEIERLTLLSQLTNLGNSIGQIARLPDPELKEIYQKLTHSRESALLAGNIDAIGGRRQPSDSPSGNFGVGLFG